MNNERYIYRGFKRLTVMISVIWIICAPFYVIISHASKYGELKTSAEKRYYDCIRSRSRDKTCSEEYASKIERAEVSGRELIIMSLIVAFAPIPVIWIILGLAIWVHKGFKLASSQGQSEELNLRLRRRLVVLISSR